MESVDLRLVRWLTGRDTGVSSKTIAAVLAGAVDPHARAFTYDVPADPDDFGRCYRLLLLMPEWRARLPEVAERFPAWTPLVDAWDELTAMYERAVASGTGRADEMYQRMRELQTGAAAR